MYCADLFQINAEVSPLLRNNNNCRVEEAEAVLLQHRKHRELMMMYRNKRLHMKALQLLSLLREQEKEQETSLDIYQETMSYLKNLGLFRFANHRWSLVGTG